MPLHRRHCVDGKIGQDALDCLEPISAGEAPSLAVLVPLADGVTRIDDGVAGAAALAAAH